MFPLPHDDEEQDDSGADRSNLDDLMSWAKGGMAKDMASRYGKPMPGDSPDETGDPSSPEAPDDGEGSDIQDVPGAEDDEGSDDEGTGEHELDPSKLKMILAALTQR